MTVSSHRSPGQIHVAHWILRAFHLAAALLALAVAALLILDLRHGWLRHSPGGSAFDINEQPWFILLFAIGALVAQRWRIVGGALAVFTASALVVFAGRQLRPFDAALVLIGFLVPALLWLVVGLFEARDERFHRSPDEIPRHLLRRRDLLTGLGVLSVTGLAGVRVGRWLFDRIYGPTHPSSTVAAVRESSTRWVWSGAVTSTSASVTSRLVDDDLQSVSLLIAPSETLQGARVVEATTADDGLVRVAIDGLEPATQYHYAFSVGGRIDQARVGRFRTFPEGPASFGLVVASCARTGSNGAVFDTIRSIDPELVIIDGDLHYADISHDDDLAFRQIYDHTLSRPAQEAMFQRCPVAYVWDDHDYGGSDRSSGSRPAAMRTYRQFVPHYPLESDRSAVHQSLSIGRVRVVMTDARSARRPGDDDEPGSMLGAAQKEWLLAELLRARDTHAATIWVNPVPWIAAGTEEGDGDDWGAYAAERRELSNFIAGHEIAPGLVMVSGDAHMLAIDDGTNTDYSDAGTAAFPLLQAGALDRTGSVKGGPYSHGTFPGGGQFGHVTIDDSGAGVTVTLTGRSWRNEIITDHRIELAGR